MIRAGGLLAVCLVVCAIFGPLQARGDEMQFVSSIGHNQEITALAFSPNGRMVLSGSKDKTLKLWDVHSGRLIRTLVGHDSSITSIAFSPDGEKAVSGADDRTVRLWELRSGKLLH